MVIWQKAQEKRICACTGVRGTDRIREFRFRRKDFPGGSEGSGHSRRGKPGRGARRNSGNSPGGRGGYAEGTGFSAGDGGGDSPETVRTATGRDGTGRRGAGGARRGGSCALRDGRNSFGGKQQHGKPGRTAAPKRRGSCRRPGDSFGNSSSGSKKCLTL